MCSNSKDANFCPSPDLIYGKRIGQDKKLMCLFFYVAFDEGMVHNVLTLMLECDASRNTLGLKQPRLWYRKLWQQGPHSYISEGV
jgi:hypothetical protein